MNLPAPNPATTDALMPASNTLLPSQARSALRDAAASLDLAERFKQPLEMSLALAQMARCYRALEAFGPAESCLQQALGWAYALGAMDQAVEIMCLLAETRCSIAETLIDDDRSHAALERTRDAVFEAAGLVGSVADPAWEIKVLLRISDVLDRCGDHDDAVELQSRAMRLMYGESPAWQAVDATPPLHAASDC
jgi:tetratricopeptide (TPR) repeat protein